MEYHWKSGAFSRNYSIETPGVPSGNIIFDSIFSSQATAVIDGDTYRISIKGVFDPDIIITTEDGKKYVMTLNMWRSKAQFADRWSWHSNSFHSKWTWKDQDGKRLISSENTNWSGTEGTITVHTMPDSIDHRLLVLAGLYTYDYYQEIAVMMILFLVIFVM